MVGAVMKQLRQMFTIKKGIRGKVLIAIFLMMGEYTRNDCMMSKYTYLT